MGLGQAVAYIFEDKLWVNKLAAVLLFTLLSFIPVFGLIPLAVLLGYLTAIVANVKHRAYVLLPRWDGWEKKLVDGGYVLVAVLIYNLPVIFLSCCLWTAPRLFAGNELMSSGTLLLSVCCVLPIILVYSIVTWSFLAVGVVRFAETNQNREFYRFSVLWSDLQANMNLTLQWVLLATLLNIILGLLIVTVCGAVLALMFAIPVHAHLIGQYALRLKSPTQPAPVTAAKPPRPRV